MPVSKKSKKKVSSDSEKHKNKVSVDEVAGDILSKETLKDIKHASLMVTLRGDKYLKLEASKEGVHFDIRLSLKQAISLATLIGGAIGGVVNYVV